MKTALIFLAFPFLCFSDSGVFQTLGNRSSFVLPKVKVDSKGLTLHGIDRFGPGCRDYCNKMLYAPDLGVALYAGGNHRVPHRMNDVWAFDLGANTWRLLYEPDGGNPGKYKDAYFLTSRTLVRKPETVLTEKQKESIENYRQWWNENIVFENGHLTTKQGGPIMPSHTWDGFCYDHAARKLLWGMGASPAAQLSTHSYFTGRSVAELEKASDPTYSPMWMFDPVGNRWIHYRTDKPRAALRGMGASMTYLPDLKQSIWYVAAQNVSPHAYEMWMFDAVNDRWTELKPNGGKSISTLARKEKVVPGSEVQMAYSPKHKKLVAVLKQDTFVYDVVENQWTKVKTDDRLFAHDAKSVFVYDDHADRFLLLFPPEGKGKAMSLAVYSLASNQWDLVEPNGPGVPETKYGMYMGYYDPKHNVFMVQGRYVDRIWVYRHKK